MQIRKVGVMGLGVIGLAAAKVLQSIGFQVAGWVRTPRKIDGLDVFVGECQSYGTHISYLPWHNVWRALFALDDDGSLDEQIRALEARLSAVDPGLVPRLPLLGVALNLPIPDTDIILFGIALGHADPAARANKSRTTREPIEANVTFVGGPS